MNLSISSIKIQVYQHRFCPVQTARKILNKLEQRRTDKYAKIDRSMGTSEYQQSEAQAGLPGLLIGFVIDYFRWLALVPMVFSWALLVLVVVVMLAINFQGGIDRMLEHAEPWVERWVGPDDADEVDDATEGQGDQAETLTFTEQDFKSWIYGTWLVAALVGYLLGLLRGWMFGPWQPASLKRKIFRAGLAAGICSASLFVAWLFGSETYVGSALGWVAMFIFFPLLVWGVSSASLSFSHLLDRIRPKVMKLTDQTVLDVMGLVMGKASGQDKRY